MLHLQKGQSGSTVKPHLQDRSLQLEVASQPHVKNSLVGGFNPSQKKYWSIGMIIPNILKNSTCSKPPPVVISIIYVCSYNHEPT